MNARHCALRYHPHYCCTSRRGYCSAAADIIEISCTPQTAQHLPPTPLLSQPATAVKYPNNNLVISKVLSTHFYTSHVADLPHAWYTCPCGVFPAGGVRTGGYPKAAPISGPLGYQRPTDWDMLWSPARSALKAVPVVKPGQLVSAVPGMYSLTKKVGFAEFTTLSTSTASSRGPTARLSSCWKRTTERISARA